MGRTCCRGIISTVCTLTVLALLPAFRRSDVSPNRDREYQADDTAERQPANYDWHEASLSKSERLRGSDGQFATPHIGSGWNGSRSGGPV
jgi:hypothetical protein